jgi:hypothetical protein
VEEETPERLIGEERIETPDIREIADEGRLGCGRRWSRHFSTMVAQHVLIIFCCTLTGEGV